MFGHCSVQLPVCEVRFVCEFMCERNSFNLRLKLRSGYMGFLGFCAIVKNILVQKMMEMRIRTNFACVVGIK